ncbi:MAG TPA: hypothetical protein VFX70_13175 [Mycobacteriales bacterium]|nr:hypothetical protein [Mycobacteriales bacterium]
MTIAALVTWIVAALGGFYLLATWLQKGGLRQQRGGPTRFPAALVFGHFLLAAVGLIVWLVFVFNSSAGTAWTAFVIILVTALLGFTMFARWVTGRGQAGGSSGAGGEVAAEQSFPLTSVLGHGAIAAVTLVLVLIAAVTA